MRLAASAGIAILALSTAALAQVAAPAGTHDHNEMMMDNRAGPDNSAMYTPSDDMNAADNMMDNSASPPPTEPK